MTTEYFGTLAVCTCWMIADMQWKPKRAFHAGTEVIIVEVNTRREESRTYSLVQQFRLRPPWNRGR